MVGSFSLPERERVEGFMNWGRRSQQYQVPASGQLQLQQETVWSKLRSKSPSRRYVEGLEHDAPGPMLLFVGALR